MAEINDPVTLDPVLKAILDDVPSPGRILLVCKRCQNLVTNEASATQIHGQHEHFCTNPYGFEFHVGCFVSALGCRESGEANAADSWFPGYFWRVAECGQCSAHLGWLFEGGGEPFYGLILDRLEQRETGTEK